MKFVQVKKMIDIRVIVIALIAALFIPMLVSGGIFRQAGFDVGDHDAKFYINGIQYGGESYLSSSDLSSVYADSQVFRWEDNKISFDIDGEIGVSPSINKLAAAELDSVTGISPDISFGISNSLQLIDLNGDLLTSGYTRKTITSEGLDMYIYHYACDLTVSAKSGKTETASFTGTTPYATAPTDAYVVRIDGVPIGTEGMTEIDVVNNLYALLSVDLPDITDWTFGWEVHIDDIDADLKSTRTNEVFKETEYESYIDTTYTESLAPIWWDYTTYININNPTRRSHSVEGRVTTFIADGEEVGSIGVDQIAIPGAYYSYYAYYGYTGLTTLWDLLEPTLIYNIILKISAIDGRDTNGDGNETTTTTTTTDDNGGFDPGEGFNWKEFVEEMTTEQMVMIGGGTFVLVMVVFMFRRRGGGY